MPKWLRKTFVVLVTIFTFGMVTPSHAILNNELKSDESPKRDTMEREPAGRLTVDNTDEAKEELIGTEVFIKQAMREAEDQSLRKFGRKITPVIEDEFREAVLPKIEKAIETVASDYPDEKLNFLAVTEMPGGGNSEKIFHIYDQEKQQDIIRFHVRRDHPPQQGFWFNFHYHTYHDSFQTHYELGSIYWDKNTPPKWMS